MIRTEGIPVGEKTSELYRITVNGIGVQAYPARVTGVCRNDVWDGLQTPLKYTEEAAFVHLEADEPLAFYVRPLVRAFTECVVRPRSAGIAAEIGRDGVRFTIEKAGQYVVEFGDDHNVLHIFIDPPAAFSKDPKDYTRYFGAGVHHVGKIVTEPGDKIYIDGGAVVYGSIYGNGVRDVTVCGYGILDGSWEERKNEKCYEDDTTGCIKFYRSENVRISGIVLRDSAVWALNAFDCEHFHVDRVKLIGMWRRNTDGFDICSSRHVALENSFFRDYDDCIVVKGVPGYNYANVFDIKVKKCVVWCDWGRGLEIGAETVADEMRDIVFEDCDVIHGAHTALDVQNCDRATVSGLVFDDIRVEYAKYRDEPPYLIGAVVINGYYGIHFDDPNVVGRNDGIIFKNISVYNETENKLRVLFAGFDGEHMTQNVTVENLTVNGEKAKEGVHYELCTNEFTKNIRFR